MLRAMVCALLLPVVHVVGRSATGDDEAAVRRAETERTAAVRAGDVGVMERILAPDYMEVSVDGRLRARPDALSLTPNSPPTESPTLHFYQDAAVVIGREAEARVLRVWLREDDRWQLVAQQAVRIQPGAPAEKPSSELLDTPRVTWMIDESPAVSAVLAAQAALDRANASGDAKAFESLTAPDFVLVTSHGLVRDRAYRVTEERLRQLSNPQPRPIVARDEVRVKIYGNTAVLRARSWPKNATGVPGMPTRFTRVWQKGPSGWQQIAAISTPFSGK